MSTEAHASLFDHAGPWTEEEYLSLPDSWRRVELVDGALLVSPNPAFPHQRLARNLLYALDAAAPEQYEVMDAINVRIRPGRILIPDIAVTDWPGFTEAVIPADRVILAVEITSPSNAGDDRVLNPEQYARAGIPHYLRIDLDRDTVAATAYTLTAGAYRPVATAEQAGCLHLDVPFAVTLDLGTLASRAHLPR
jgi:Uma2 family endonuclease